MTAVGCRFLTFVVIVAFTAACTSSNGSPSPSPTPPTGSTSTSSTSPEPSEPLTTGPNVRPGEKPPEFPALAKKHTANGALAFAAYYYLAFDWGYATNDPYLVSRISAPRCEGCRKYINGLHSLDASGGVLHGGRVAILERGLRYGHFSYKSDYVARIVLDEQRIVIDRPRKPRRTIEPAVSRYVQYVFVSWRRGAWTVVEVASD